MDAKFSRERTACPPCAGDSLMPVWLGLLATRGNNLLNDCRCWKFHRDQTLPKNFGLTNKERNSFEIKRTKPGIASKNFGSRWCDREKRCRNPRGRIFCRANNVHAHPRSHP